MLVAAWNITKAHETEWEGAHCMQAQATERAMWRPGTHFRNVGQEASSSILLLRVMPCAPVRAVQSIVSAALGDVDGGVVFCLKWAGPLHCYLLRLLSMALV
jgi:hypothetical protein